MVCVANTRCKKVWVDTFRPCGNYIAPTVLWPAQEDCNGSMCSSYQGASFDETSHFATGAPGTPVCCTGDLEGCSASTIFCEHGLLQTVSSGLFSTCLGGFLFGFQPPQPKSYIGEQALQLCHRLCMVFRDVEIAVMGRLEHGNYSVKSSPEHWGIRHVHSHAVHS